MSNIISASDLTAGEKRLLFWASFLSLAAAGVGFAFRVAMGGEYGAELDLSNQQIGEVFGASLWPIALTMIGFSLVIDRTGYKLPMVIAFLLQVGSGVGTFLADSYLGLYLAALAAGLGHGIVEAVINPVCAAVYPREKTKWLTILHAAWPAGLVLGTLLIIGGDTFIDGGMTWRAHALWILVPAVPYLFMYLPCKFPIDERVQAGVPYIEMLRQVGFLTAFLASGL
ncbi:MAG: MFS family permease, partial [Planctomycetota bacterium]